MLLNMVMFKITICDFGKMNIKMTDKMKKSIFILGAVVLMTSCSTKNQTEYTKYIRAITKDVPFPVNGLRTVDDNMYVFEGVNSCEVPDYEISKDGVLTVTRTTLWKLPKNDVENIWRNLYFNKRQHRLVCVDRINKAGKTILGIMYVMQTESKKWPERGVYHWDVTDMHNMQSVAISLEDFKNKSIRVMQSGTLPDVEESRKYNSLISKADSSYMQQNYQEAERYFTHAFDFKNYVRGQHLYNAACVASLAGHKDTAFWFLEERMKAEPEWYSLNIETDKDLLPIHDDVRWNEIMNAMHERQTKKEANYDIPLRNQLLEIAKDDQAIRQEWRMTSRQQPQDTAKIDSIFSVMATIDSVNQQKIFKILDSRGFVGKDKVGDACRAYWLVVQHSSVEMQRKYLPLFLKAAERGDIPRENVAMMEDRICLFEGRPQRYGTQLEEDKDGKWHLYKLENPEKVDEYRKSVGMGTLSDYLKMMGIKL